MEIEIELNVTLTADLAQKVRDSLSKKFELISFNVPGKFSLRPTDVVDEGTTIDAAIYNYLDAIESFAPLLEQAGAVLRVGTFFSEGEAAAFSVLLPKSTIQLLAKHHFAIDVTCYPCA